MSVKSFPSISILLHIYYPDTYQYLLEKLSVFADLKVQLLVNICMDTPDKNKIIEAIKAKFPSTHFISTANIGKDIGGKLALFSLMKYNDMNSDWLLLLHDKKSPQSVNGESWREELYKVFDRRYFEKLELLMNKKATGIIGSKENLVYYSKKENDVTQDSNFLMLQEQSRRFQLKLKKFSYIGGTTFWMRKEIMDLFFNEHDPLELRKELEKGNVIDNHSPQKTHTWERLFGLITINKGFKVEGI